MTFVAGQAGQLAFLNNINDAWTAYTPTWQGTGVNPVIGNGTLTGRYKQIGKTVHFRLRVVTGTTTTVGAGSYLFGLPVAAAAAVSMDGTPGLVGGATGIFPVAGSAATTTTFAATTPAGTAVTTTNPTTLPAGSYIQFSGTYEAA